MLRALSTQLDLQRSALRHQQCMTVNLKERAMRALTAMTIVALTVLSPCGADADTPRGTRDPRINARQEVQRERIQQGVRSGELTRRETRRAVEDQRDVRQLERAYKSDGELTRGERRDLTHEQNQASRQLYRDKHDAQDRTPAAIRDPGINQRQANQADRVVQGVKSGELTRGEAQELREERRDIRDLERDYKSDRVLTPEERRDLNQQLNQNSREIFEEKRDDERR
jgi:hypothetical protein